MSMTDPLADMLTRIRNGQNARLAHVIASASKLNASVLEVLKNEGYIRDYSKEEVRPGISQLKVELKYNNNVPVIKILKRISKPGRRSYSSITNLKKFYNGLGISIISTPKGVMSDYNARLANVGGEVLCCVF